MELTGRIEERWTQQELLVLESGKGKRSAALNDLGYSIWKLSELTVVRAMQ